MLIILALSVILPLISAYIGIIINLKYPNLEAESSTEVVKQSTSSLLSVMIGMILLVLNILIISKTIVLINPTLLLATFVIGYIIIDLLLYVYLTKISVKDFNKLTI